MHVLACPLGSPYQRVVGICQVRVAGMDSFIAVRVDNHDIAHVVRTGKESVEVVQYGQRLYQFHITLYSLHHP